VPVPERLGERRDGRLPVSLDEIGPGMMRITTPALLVALFCVRAWSAAEPIVIERDMYERPLGKYLDILEDPRKQWTIDDIASEPVSDLFVTSQEDSPNVGFTQSAYWVRFTVVNHLRQEITWLLELAYPPMDHIQLYLPIASNQFDVKYAGDSLPFNEREIRHRTFIFHMKQAPNSQSTYYMRFETEGAVNLPLLMYSYEALAEKIDKEQILIGIYHGAVLVMLIYNFFIFLSIKDLSYLYYVLFNVGWVLAMFTLNGLSFQYLWPSTASWWTDNSLLFFFCWAFFWGVQFSRTFLNTMQHIPAMDWGLRALLGLAIAGMASALLLSYAFSVRLTNVIGMCSLYVWVSGFMCWRKEVRPARYYLPAWTALIVGIAALSLKNFGLLPHNLFTIWAPQIGSATEITLLSLGLADRIKILQQEKESAQNELLATRLNQQEVLLKEVHHRVKNNLQVIASLLSLQSGYVKDERSLAMFLESQQRVESMALLHEQLYRSPNSERIDFTAYAHTLLTHVCQAYGAGTTVQSAMDDVVISLDTAVPCGLILHELISNALKHAFPDGTSGTIAVTLQAHCEGRYTLKVHDTGVGFPPELDFRHTSSLGLQLVHMLVDQLDGTIELTTVGGTTFTVTFAELHYKDRGYAHGV
jgi:two-component sensor histidine kinase